MKWKLIHRELSAYIGKIYEVKLTREDHRRDPEDDEVAQGIGAMSAVAAQAAEQVPKAALQARMAGATPTPAVIVPKVAPAPA